ncbi:hypothetical protein DFH11DRAFT_1751403 [Phellopilus nigrolimitatus]|nr:hypothetical protein DFH11DRAFT_1751403 [Phellopilus nigrolimitatus]
MAKKITLKAALSSQQARFKRNAKSKKAEEASQRSQKQNAVDAAKGKGKEGKATTVPSKITKARKRSTIPFRASDTILLVGEGNFSFTLALLSHPALQYLPAQNVTATAYDSEDECFEKYPEAHAIVEELKKKGAQLLFSIDATALEKCKLLKGRKWDRIVFNFPHAGKGITDQDRNILSNQVLILGFLRSVGPFLVQGTIPAITVRRKKKKSANDSGSEDEGPIVDDDDSISEDEELGTEESQSLSKRDGTRGTVLVTLRNVHPYSEWNLPKLAKNPPPPSSLSEKTNPHYLQLRSFVFNRSDWAGYEHRMTKGEPAHGTGKTGQGGEDRMWEFCLKE